jgi:hypothetical protein
MEVFIIYLLASSILWIGVLWIGLAVVVGVAANTRGRDGGGWFVLAVLISPIIAGLLLVALPRNERTPGYGITFSEALPGGQKRREARTVTEQIEKDRRQGVFRPDGMVGNMPYRVLPNGEAEGLVQGSVLRFQDLDHLRSFTAGTPEEPPAAEQEEPLAAEQEEPLAAEQEEPLAAEQARREKQLAALKAIEEAKAMSPILIVLCVLMIFLVPTLIIVVAASR